MEEIRIFVTSDFATFACPKCDKARTADVSKILANKAEIKIKCKCKCGYLFKATLERRKFFRKDIKLSGSLQSKKEMKPVLINVVDISRSGCKAKLSKGSNTFSVGERILIEFHLDDLNKSLVKKNAIIRSNTGILIGVEFDSIDAYDKLGHYLMFS